MNEKLAFARPVLSKVRISTLRELQFTALLAHSTSVATFGEVMNSGVAITISFVGFAVPPSSIHHLPGPGFMTVITPFDSVIAPVVPLTKPCTFTFGPLVLRGTLAAVALGGGALPAKAEPTTTVSDTVAQMAASTDRCFALRLFDVFVNMLFSLP
jgi:hypothetical protein